MMFTPAHVAKPSSPPPDEPRVVGARRDRRSRRRSGRERSAPAPISRGRSGHIRPSKEQGRAGTQHDAPVFWSVGIAQASPDDDFVQADAAESLEASLLDSERPEVCLFAS